MRSPRLLEPLLRGGDPSDTESAPTTIVDPTNQLLRQIDRVESRIPWGLVGVILVTLLWLPTLSTLSRDWETAPTVAEQPWVGQTLSDSPPIAHESYAAAAVSRELWKLTGVDAATVDDSPQQRLRARVPTAIASLAALLAFLVLATRIAGPAAGLLAVALAGVSPIWLQAGSNAAPWLLGEALLLMGLARLVTLQSRHREVGVAAASALSIGAAGALFGLGLLFLPTHLPTLVAAILAWLFLGLRRANSRRTSLPVRRPADVVFFTLVGTALLLIVAVVAGRAAEWGAGGSGFPYLGTPPIDLRLAADRWPDWWRSTLSPLPITDLLWLALIPGILFVGVVEKWRGTPWTAAGLLPWIFLGAYFVLVARAAQPVLLQAPVVLSPLFALGVGWLLLRGIRSGRVHRQEYGLLLIWLVLVVGLAPLITTADSQHISLALALTLLPPVTLTAARAGRALWEADDSVLGRIAVLLLIYLPVVLFAVEFAVRRSVPGVPWDLSTLDARRWAYFALIPVGLGVLSELLQVRPSAARARASGAAHSSRAGRRGAGGRRHDARDRSSAHREVGTREGRGKSGSSRRGKRGGRRRSRGSSGSSSGGRRRPGGSSDSGGSRRSGGRSS